jgi:hypothetical protein
VPQSLPPGLTREHVLRAPAGLDAGAAHPLGPPAGYESAHGNKRYAPNAAVGPACLDHLGRPLRPFHAGRGGAGLPGWATAAFRYRVCTLLLLAPRAVGAGDTDLPSAEAQR